MLEKNVELLKQLEGCELKAYTCSAGEITIGYGATYYQNYQKVQPGDVITQKEADELLLFHIGEFEKAINIALENLPLPQDSRDALVIFCFNTGITAFLKSALYKKIKEEKNNLTEIEKQFNRWVYANGKVLKGLQNRRKKEYQLYEKGILSQYSKAEIFHKCNLK